jgi:hypothetical protein
MLMVSLPPHPGHRQLRQGRGSFDLEKGYGFRPPGGYFLRSDFGAGFEELRTCQATRAAKSATCG